MKFKTREASSSIQGKPKVYIAGHPADMTAHLEHISAEILEQYNCAIFYDENLGRAVESEQFLNDLDQMQLIVLIVSQIYTQEETAAHTIVFRHAIQQNIPVLPILEAKELEVDLNDSQNVIKDKNDKKGKLLGRLNVMLMDRQFLNPHDTDKTAINYNSKLKKYLDSVLIKDELADQIRAAFDAYVFLSYRKKDRLYAQELMKLIHKNTFCRDIAIWYDEFLVPGENFNSAIQDAMQKSELFALMVTPNILEENNYVMTTEYPAAKEASKKILPVTMTPTDMQSLREHFDSIPEPIDVTDAQLLADALARELANVMNTEYNKDPQHVFFIGLAYLQGIDVEVDKERALELITYAAQHDAGVRDAVKKLADMYYTGEGTEQDYSEAAKWYEKLIELDWKKYEKKHTAEQAAIWIDTMLSYGKCMQSIGNSLSIQDDNQGFFYNPADRKGAEHYKKSHEIYAKIVQFCEQANISEYWSDLYITACASMKQTSFCAEDSSGNFSEPMLTCLKRIIQSRNLPTTLEELEQRLAQDDAFREGLPLDADYCKPFHLLYEEYRSNCRLGDLYPTFHLRGKTSGSPEQADLDAAIEAIEIYMKLTGTDWTLGYLHIVTELERRIELQKRFVIAGLTEKDPFESFLAMKAIMKSYYAFISQETDFERVKNYYEECLATMKAFSELDCFPYIMSTYWNWYTRDEPGFYTEDLEFVNVFEAMLRKAPEPYREVCAKDYYAYMCRVVESCPKHYSGMLPKI